MIRTISHMVKWFKPTSLQAVAGNTSHIKIFLILCIQFVLCMDCQFMK